MQKKVKKNPAIQQKKLLNESMASLYDKSTQLYSAGFDTIKIGLPIRSRNYFNSHNELLKLCDTIGATLHKVKYSDEANPLGPPLITEEKKLYAFFYEKHKKGSSISTYFYNSYGAWIIEYKGIMHWVINWMRAKQLTLEIYGLSQLHHFKGSIRFELLNKILAFYHGNYNLPTILAYDISIDFNKPYEEVYSTILIPFVHLKKKKPKLGFYPYIDYKGARSIYLQGKPARTYTPQRSWVMYDKKSKNNLSNIDALCRLEVRVNIKKNIERHELTCYEDLFLLLWRELVDMNLMTNDEYAIQLNNHYSNNTLETNNKKKTSILSYYPTKCITANLAQNTIYYMGSSMFKNMAIYPSSLNYLALNYAKYSS